MIAGDDGEGKLAGNHFIALARRRHFDRQHALVRIDLRQVRDEAVDMLVTLRRIFGRHALARMLPDIAQRRRESDIAALGLRVGGDILHLVEEEFARVERETFLGLVAIVEWKSTSLKYSHQCATLL